MFDSICLGEVSEVAPGELQMINLPLPALYSQSPVSMPVTVVNGRRAGPVLFVSGGIHGDEINGVEIIRRLLNVEQIRQLKGALIAVPVVNVYGFVGQSRFLPDGRDLNRSFPGSEKGSMAARLAETFMNEIVSKCTHGIDLHTAPVGFDNFPQIRARVSDSKETERLACAFGSAVILNAELHDGSLRHAASDRNIPVMVYEAGEALRFDEVAIRAGVEGILNVMRHLEMLPGTKPTTPPSQPLIAKSSQWVRASQSGVLRAIATLGSRVEKGELIGRIADPFGMCEEQVLATSAGIIIGKTNLPLVYEGEALFHIASFTEPDSAAEIVEHF